MESEKANQFSFTTDWFSNHQVVWDRTITPHLAAIDGAKVLEVGAFEGRSCIWFLRNFPSLSLTVIDPWSFTDGASEETFNRFSANISPFSERVKVMRGKSQLMRTLPDQEYDVIYLDGDHTSAAVIHDAVLAYELLKPGGLLIFDDYLGGDRSIKWSKPAIDFFGAAYGALFRVELVSDTYQRVYRRLV
jgi:predicted NAD/FAD-binding protein